MIVERAVPHRFDGRRDRGVGRDHQHLHAEPAALDLADEFQAVHAGHLQVGDDDVDRPLGQPAERFDGAGARGDVVAGVAQHVGHGFAGRGVVVDHQHAESIVVSWRYASCGGSHRLRRGILIVNAAPPSGQFIAVTVPPWASATWYTIGQAQAGAVLLGAVERLERAALDLRRSGPGRCRRLRARSRARRRRT